MAREMKIGDQVLCIDDVGCWRGASRVFSGREYVITGFMSCPSCGLETVILKGFDLKVLSECHCGNVSPIREFRKSRFILPDLASLEAHRVEVSAKELLTIKEVQHQ